MSPKTEAAFNISDPEQVYIELIQTEFGLTQSDGLAQHHDTQVRRFNIHASQGRGRMMSTNQKFPTRSGVSVVHHSTESVPNW